jgi:pimeloyl-CoA synthetase
MNSMLKNVSLVFISMAVSACSYNIQQHPENKPVRLIFYNEINVATKNYYPDCQYLGELISSEGHWYDYLFISNIDLTQGAINDMHNKANKIGANLVYINSNIDFSTSVTFLGQAYACEVNNEL